MIAIRYLLSVTCYPANIERLEKSLSLLLRLESNLLAKTGNNFFFWLGHFEIYFPKTSKIIHKLSIVVAFGGETLQNMQNVNC